MISSAIVLVKNHQFLAVIALGILTLVVWKSLQYASEVFGDEDHSSRTWLLSLAIPFGSGLMCYRFIQSLTRFLKSGQTISAGPVADLREGALKGDEK